jgi:DNA invertase Pin-like site-specific DNA recombinase
MSKGFVSYLRVSTDKQGKSGLGLEAQREAVSRYLNGGAWELQAEFLEVETGKRADCPQLRAAIAHCRKTGAALVIAKLDRLARNVCFIAALMEQGVPFVACDLPTATPFMLHVYAAMAEEEARAISARTKAALAAAKARGVKLGGWRGGPPRDPSFARAGAIRAADAYAADVGPAAKTLRARGMSLRQVAAELAGQGVRTPRGGEWSAAAVRAVLLRAA